MELELPKCTQPVDANKNCIHYNGACVKNGKAYGKQRFLCRSCNRTFVAFYTYTSYNKEINEGIVAHLKEGSGIRSIGKLLKIGKTTVLKRILWIARTIKKPIIPFGHSYEVDELCTFIQQKTTPCWIIYALSRETKEVVDFTVGNRSNVVLKRVTDNLLLSGAKAIYTDKLVQYKIIIPGSIHRTSPYGTNHIERKNLTLRTDLKRLSRRTICFSRSIAILTACLKIYFWSNVL